MTLISCSAWQPTGKKAAQQRAQSGKSPLVVEVARRLRCQEPCGERPYRVELVPDPRCSHKGEMFRVPGKPPVLLIGDKTSAAAPDEGGVLEQPARPPSP